MIKKIILTLVFTLVFICPSYAQKIPVKIAPLQIISTHKDEIELGDRVKFQVVRDVYVNEKLYIKKNSTITGVADFIHPNGWAGDNAQITLNNFHVKGIDNKDIEINYPLLFDGGSETGRDTKEVISYLLYITFLFRGGEIYIEPDTKVYNIFIETDEH